MALIGRVLARRATLRRRFDLARQFAALEEGMVPSYLHANPVAAAVAWWRLVVAARLYRRHAPAGPILDFGAGTGELRQVLHDAEPYDFIEGNELLAQALIETNPPARRATLERLPARRYAAVFALDSLEHNDDVPPLLDALVRALAPDGAFILSGPTENALYRLGRRVAGFRGDYHKTTVHDIERAVAERLAPVARCRVPFGLPLFRVSVWRRRGDAPAP